MDDFPEAPLYKVIGISRGVIDVYDTSGLKSRRLATTHEIKGYILKIAQGQLDATQNNTDKTQKQVQLEIAAFLTGAALEDALRRLCDARDLDYNRPHTSISKLQTVLYQPNRHIEVISKSENKHITAWCEIRNSAAHARFPEIHYAEVASMVTGVREFINRHLLWREEGHQSEGNENITHDN